MPRPTALPILFAPVLAASAAPAAAAEPRVIEAGVAVVGAYGLVGLGKPSSFEVAPGVCCARDSVYPGFFGLGGGVGVTVEMRYAGYVGLEVGFLRTSDFGEQEITVTAQDRRGREFEAGELEIEIGQKALHIPVLLKGVLPLELVRPNVFVGIEFVRPGASHAEVTESGSVVAGGDYGARAGNYSVLAFGAGLEFVLPIEGVDLRIPLALRGGYNTGTSDKLYERGELVRSGDTITGVTYVSEWQWHGAVTGGLAYHHGLL